MKINKRKIRIINKSSLTKEAIAIMTDEDFAVYMGWVFSNERKLVRGCDGLRKAIRS